MECSECFSRAVHVGNAGLGEVAEMLAGGGPRLLDVRLQLVRATQDGDGALDVRLRPAMTRNRRKATAHATTAGGVEPTVDGGRVLRARQRPHVFGELLVELAPHGADLTQVVAQRGQRHAGGVRL